MKKINLFEKNGFSSMFVLIGMLLVAISLPIATKLVQQNQENRSNAAEVQCESSDTKCEGGYKYTCSSHKWKKTTIKCGTTPATTCTYTVSWGACKPGGTKVGVLKASPEGCTGGTKPATVANCTYVAPASTCTYTCEWSDCKADSSSLTGGTQSCTAESKSPTGCTGGSSKLGTTRNCSLTTTSAYWYYSGSCKSAGSYVSQSACQTAHSGSACYVSLDACNLAHPSNTSTTTTKDCACGTTAGTCTLGTAAWKDQYGTSGSYTWSCTGSSCNPKNCSITNSNPPSSSASPKCGTDSYTCIVGTHSGLQTGSNGITRWTCTSGGSSISCTYTPPTSTTVTSTGSGVCATNEVGTYKCGTDGNVWYCKQDPRTDGVKSGTWGISSNCTGGCSVVNNKAECKLVSNCTLGATKCYGGNVYECKHQTATNTGVNDWSLTGTCSIGCSVDGGGKAFCDTCTSGATRCVGDKVSVCNAAGTAWDTTDCKNGCANGKCKTGGGSGGSGGSGYYSSGLSVTPDTLTLKVGESAVVTATEDVTWSSDTATVATVTSEGIVTGVTVGTATVTATTDLGETAVVAVTVIASDTGTLSFKVAFAGIKPSYVNNSGESYSCIGSLGDLTVDVLNRVSNVSQTLSNVQVSVVGNEVDSKGNQVFQVSNLDVGSSLMGANTNNFVKVKGPFHLRRRMCTDGQSGKTDDATVCNINLFSSDSYVYDFSEYTLLAGDANLDGVINSVDFSLVKNAVNADAELECGRQYDLNMDGVVNSLDLNLVKDALSSKDDE